METSDDTDTLVMEYTFNRPVLLDDVVKIGGAIQKLLNAIYGHIAGDPKATLPLDVKHLNFTEDGEHKLTFTIQVPRK